MNVIGTVFSNSRTGAGKDPDGGVMGESNVTDLSRSAVQAECSVLIATYNRPGPLRLVLMALNVQSVKCFEVLICDDGSGPETLEMITSLGPELDLNIRYVRHEDKGFRKAMILNRGILASRTDYLLFLDDDCIPHSRYIENHLRAKRPGTLVFGKFVRVRPELAGMLTDDVIKNRGIDKRPFFTPGNKIDLAVNRFRFYRHLLLKNPLRPKLYGANFALEKASLLDVNGFNEEFEGWGYEDNELRLRLVNNGIRMREVITRAIVFHLIYFQDRNPAQYETGRLNKELFLKLRYEKWAPRGLSEHKQTANNRENTERYGDDGKER